MGKGGAVAMLLVVFMAVTSAASAELIAVSSLFSYDVYRTYFRPDARGPEIVRVSHYFICFWAVWMGAWSAILHKAGVDLGWLFYVQGVVLSPAVIPIGLTVTWSKLTRAGVISGSVLGAVLGMIAWVVGCLKIYGSITITNLALPYSAVCSGLTGLLFSGITTVGVSLINPADYDFRDTRAIANLDDLYNGGDTVETGSDVKDEKKNDVEESVTEVTNADLPSLRAAFRRATWYSLTLTAIVTIIVPLPMFFSHYVYGKPFYMFWVSISIIWVLLSGTFSVLLPVWESRKEIGTILFRAYRSLLQRKWDRIIV